MSHWDRIEHKFEPRDNQIQGIKEIWKDIPGYEGVYQVSDLGSVKGLERKDCRGRTRKERIMVPLNHRKGYRCIHLHKDGHCKTFKIHRLVAMAFLSDFSENRQVDHINGIRDCNIVSNLRMVTNSENKSNMKKISGCSSRFKGVNWHKGVGKWCATIKKDGRCFHIGSYASEEEAAEAYDEAAGDLFGVYANTNKQMGLL